MRCKSFKNQKLSFWLIIAIAIVAANLSASEAEGAAGSQFVVERRGVIAKSRHFIMLDHPDAFANALDGVLTADRGGRDR